MNLYNFESSQNHVLNRLNVGIANNHINNDMHDDIIEMLNVCIIQSNNNRTIHYLRSLIDIIVWAGRIINNNQLINQNV